MVKPATAVAWQTTPTAVGWRYTAMPPCVKSQAPQRPPVCHATMRIDLSGFAQQPNRAVAGPYLPVDTISRTSPVTLPPLLAATSRYVALRNGAGNSLLPVAPTRVPSSVTFVARRACHVSV